MKKLLYPVILILLVCTVSCKKVYNCSCSFNNQVVLNKDLGNQVLKNAKTQCSAYDSTVTGEVWNCTVY